MFDPNAAWRQLSAETQNRVSAATVAYIAGLVGEGNSAEPKSQYLAARKKSLDLIEELIREGLTEAFNENDQPFVPDLAALGIDVVETKPPLMFAISSSRHGLSVAC